MFVGGGPGVVVAAAVVGRTVEEEVGRNSERAGLDLVRYLDPKERHGGLVREAPGDCHIFDFEGHWESASDCFEVD